MRTMTEPEKPRNKGGRPKSPNPRKNVVTVRGSEEWREWLKGLGRHVDLDVADVINQAVREYAVNHGFPKKPPER